MLTETQRLEHLSPCDLIAFSNFDLHKNVKIYASDSDNTADIVIIFVLGKENESCKLEYRYYACAITRQAV